jgi:adenylate kinase
MKNLVILGAPGAGKGTQAVTLAKKLAMCHISTGDILRKEIADGTTLGKKTKDYLDKGLLVPDQIVIDMLENYLVANDAKCKGYIFDGFPRTVAQAEALDKMLAKHKNQIDKAIYFKVPQKELIKRIRNRGLTSGRSDDTSLKIIHERLVQYATNTKPVLAYYKKQKKYFWLNGVGSIDDIFNTFYSIAESK